MCKISYYNEVYWWILFKFCVKKPNLFEKDIKMSILQGELFVECVKLLVNDVSG